MHGTVPLRRLRVLTHPARRAATLRAWVRRGEVGVVLLAVLVGAAAGVLAFGLGSLAQLMHGPLFGLESGQRLSGLGRGLDPGRALLVPATGGLLLGLLGLWLAKVRPRSPIDPVEANALHGGRMSLGDALVVGVQTLLSNGFGASVGLEAAYTQAGGGIASRLGAAFGLRRGDLRTLVGAGAAGAIAAAFNAPLTGAFYGFELIIGSYSTAALVPVMASSVTATVVGRWLEAGSYQVEQAGIGDQGWEAWPLALGLGVICALLGIALMRGVTLIEAPLRRLVPWAPLRPVLGGLAVGALALVSPAVLSSGHAALHLAFVTEAPAWPVAVVLGLKALAVAISLGSGFRGGLFFASLLLGALTGKLGASLLAMAMPPGPDPLLLAIVGMSAFGTAVIGAPLSMTFLALETTANFEVTSLVLAAVCVSALIVRRLFGYSFATWRFHVRGETIRSAHDIGWLRDLTAGRLMRRDLRTVRADTPIDAFRRAFPLGSVSRVVALDEEGRYAGLISVSDAYSTTAEVETVAPLLQLTDRVLLPAMNARMAMTAFEAAEAEALVVVDSMASRKPVGLLTEAHLLRRYSEEVDKRRREELGLTGA
jgi:chloride channel protein, CIC family